MTPRIRRGPLSITASTLLLMSATILGRILGQLREILIAPKIGVGAVSDGYIIGFQIPDLMFQLLIGGAIQAAVTPMLAGAIERRQLREGWRSISIFMNLTGLAMLLLVVLGIVLAPVLLPLLYSGRTDETMQVAVSVTRVLLPQALFMMLAALSRGILNAYRRFERTAFGPVFYNVGVVLSLLLLGDRTVNGTVRVAAGIMLSACLFFLLQLALARKEFTRYYRFSLDWKDPGFRRLFRLALPTMLAASITQVNMIVLTAFANRMFPEDGIVTALRYASTTWLLPYGILAVAIGNVLLPNLSAQASADRPERFRRLFGNGLRNALYVLVPIAVLILALREDVVRGIFQWGPSLPEETISVTASILLFYCGSIIVQSLVFLFSIGYFSVGNTRVPLLAGSVSLVVNVVTLTVLSAVPGIGPWAMSLSYLLAGSASAAILVRLFRRRYFRFRPVGLTRRYLLQLLLCSAAAALVVTAMSILAGSVSGKLWQLLWLTVRGFAGLGVFYLATHGLQVPEAGVWAGRVLGAVSRLRRLAGIRRE